MTTVKVNQISQFAGHQSYSPGKVVDDPDTNRAAYLLGLGSVVTDNGTPENLVAPKIIKDGAIVTTAEVDDVLMCSPGEWEGLASANVTDINLAYQWQSNGTNINAATSNIHTVVVDEVNITCEVRATNAVNTAMAESQIVTVVVE